MVKRNLFYKEIKMMWSCDYIGSWLEKLGLVGGVVGWVILESVVLYWMFKVF